MCTHVCFMRIYIPSRHIHKMSINPMVEHLLGKWPKIPQTPSVWGGGGHWRLTRKMYIRTFLLPGRLRCYGSRQSIKSHTHTDPQADIPRRLRYSLRWLILEYFGDWCRQTLNCPALRAHHPTSRAPSHPFTLWTAYTHLQKTTHTSTLNPARSLFRFA